MGMDGSSTGPSDGYEVKNWRLVFSWGTGKLGSCLLCCQGAGRGVLACCFQVAASVGS